MSRLAVRLFVAFLLVAAVAIGIVALTASRSATSGFTSYVAHGDLARAEGFQSYLSSLYQEPRGWVGLDSVLAGLAAAAGDRLLVTDTSGRAVGDSQGELTGRQVQLGAYGVVLPISREGEVRGYLHFLPPDSTGMEAQMRRVMGGQGMMGGAGPGGMMGMISDAPVPVSFVPPKQDFLGSLRRSLWLAGLGAVLAAALISLLIVRYVTLPVGRLRRAAAAVAGGDLSARVEATSSDELGELANSFNHMAESLARQEAVRRTLMQDIAHELRTPLTVMQGTLEALQDGVLEPTPERLESCRQEVALLSRLVDDLRDLSLAEAGQLRLHKMAVDLLPFLERAVATHQAQARQRGVSLSLATSLPAAPVEADLQRLDQVVGNLLSNALRHTPQGGSITVSVSKDGHRAVVSVADTGGGIPPEELPRVFDRFYRGDPSRSRATGGSGLGLSIVKGLVEMHGGQVWAESTVGQGSRFSFSLPLKAA